MATPVPGFIRPVVRQVVRVPPLPNTARPSPRVTNPTGQEWPANPFSPVDPWWTRPDGRPPGDWGAANSRPRTNRVQASNQYLYDEFPQPVTIEVVYSVNTNATAVLTCGTAQEREPASSTVSQTVEVFHDVLSFEYIGGITQSVSVCGPVYDVSRPYAFTEIKRWKEASGTVRESTGEHTNYEAIDPLLYFRSSTRRSARITKINGANYQAKPLPLPDGWVQPDATPDEPATEPEWVPSTPSRPPLAPPVAPPVEPPEETPPDDRPYPPVKPGQPEEPGVSRPPAPAPTPAQPVPAVTPSTGGGGGGSGGGGAGVSQMLAGEEMYLGQKIGQVAQRPQLTAAGTAEMLGKLEQKLVVLGDKLTPPEASTGLPAAGLGDLLGLIWQLLTAPYPAGGYQLENPCKPSEEPVAVGWDAGIGEFAELRARVDALAQLLQAHKSMGQPVCVKERQGAPVTVILKEQL